MWSPGSLSLGPKTLVSAGSLLSEHLNGDANADGLKLREQFTEDILI
jgi:hypothetical protein